MSMDRKTAELRLAAKRVLNQFSYELPEPMLNALRLLADALHAFDESQGLAGKKLD